MGSSQKNLAQLSKGNVAIITDFAEANVDPAFVCRVMQMGLTEGTQIEVAYTAPFGGTIAIRCRGTLIALRSSDAQNIYIREVEHA